MTHELTEGAGEGRDAGERARTDFLDFLNDARPPLFVAKSLAWLLRTEPPLNADPDDVAELIAAWGEHRADATRQAVSVLYANAIRRVLDTHRELALEGFDPGAFIDGVARGLVRHCPPSEAGGLLAVLRDLRAANERVAAPPQPPEAGGDTIEVHGQRMSLRAGQEAAISRLEHEAYMSDAEFESAYEDLQRAMSTRLGVPVHSALARIATASAKIFNTGRIRQAARLAEFVVESFTRLAIAPEGRLEIQFAVGENDINEGLLLKALNDAEQREVARPLVRLFGYLNPGEALVTLGVENRRERRRLLLAALETYGADGYSVILDHLAAFGTTGHKWYAARNFLYLLSREDPPDETSRRRAVEAAGKYITNDQPQVRSAALAALRRIGGREVIPFVVRALDPGAYPAGSIDDTDALRRFLAQAMETIVETGNEAAMAIVAEIATGHRGSEFDLGPALRDEACAALAHRKGPLPRRPALVIASYLAQLCSRRIKIVTGRLSFGIDPHACQSLSALIRASSEPEAREALEHPFLQRVLAKGSGEA
jgi:hypothetical protein